jgi:streptogramin lyase
MRIQQRTITTFLPGFLTGGQVFIKNTADINNKKIVDIEWQTYALTQTIPYGSAVAIPVVAAATASAHLFLCLRQHNTVQFAHHNLPLTALLRTYSPVINVTPAADGNVGNLKQWHRYCGNIDWTTSYFTSPLPLGAAPWYYVNLLVTYEEE